MKRLLAAAVCAAALSHAVLAQTLRIGMRDDPDILDPTFSRTYVGTLLMTALCDKLVDFDAKLNLVPVLASGWEWTDSQTLLLHIRPNLRFQNGEPLDAVAVKYTLDRDLGASGSFRRSEISAMDHVEIADPLTVRVSMRQAFSPFLAVLTDRAGMMVPPKAAEAAGKEFGLHPVCSGPFRFVERIAQDHITMERWPDYPGAAKIHFDRVTYRVIPDSSIRLSNLQAGTLDLAEVAPLDADTVKRDGKLVLASTPSLGYGSLTINIGDNARANTPLGRDARVRRAFALSIDRDALNQVVFAGLYVPNAQATSSVSPLYSDAIAVPKRDVAGARALLKEAGVTAPLAVSLIVANTPQTVQAGEVIQSMAAEAGFDVHVDAMEFGASIAAVNRGDFAVSLGGWSGLLDTDSNAWSMLHSGGSLNWAHYANATVDTMLDRARTTSDVAARRGMYEAVWKQVGADLPVVYLWTPRVIVGHTAKLHGFTAMPDGLYRLQGVAMAN